MPSELQLSNDAPWKARFRAPRIAYTQLAKAAPERGLAAGNMSGAYQLYAWDVPTGELRQLTDRPSGQLSGSISPDGRYIYYLDDEQGNEIGHYVRVPFEGGEPEDVTPDMPLYSSWVINVSRSGDLLGFTVADATGFHTHLVDLGSDGSVSASRVLYSGKKLTFGPFLSTDSSISLLTTTERAEMQYFNMLALDTSSGEAIGELWDGPETSLKPLKFSPVEGDDRILATSNRSGNTRPLLWNPRTGERIDLDLGDVTGEVVPYDWSEDGKRVLLCQFERAVQQLYIYELESGSLTRLNHPSGTYGFYASLGTYFGPSGEVFAQWQDSTHPPQVIALDADTGEQTRVVLIAGDVPRGHPWEPVSFTSSDGQQIQAWLGLPDGEAPFPVILHTHGGPESVTTEMFNPLSQAWLDHGFAFLSVNYRGSTTFGREFQQKIWGGPGHWEVEDMAAGYRWLVDSGVAVPDEVFLTGGSYGGYLTLLGLGKRPDLWAGGMAEVAIADWTMLYEDSADTIRGYQRALFGGTPDEKSEAYAAGSPITYVEAVRAPLLVIQGRNDTRCPDRQMEVYEAKMKELGKPIEVVWFDAGHGSYLVEQQVEHMEAMLRFAYRVLSEGTRA